MSNSTPSTASAGLGQLDLSVLDQLALLQTELEQVDGRLRSMEGRRDAVAEEVYNRVRRDYMSQRQALLESAEPLREQARGLHTKVQAALIEIERDFNTVQMDLEEIAFRHALGEFDDAEKERRSKAKASALKERQAARDEALALRARFAKAFPALEQEAESSASAAPAARPSLAESEDPTQRVNKVSEDEIRTAELPSPEEPRPAARSSAVEAPRPPEPPAPPPPRRNPDATVVFRPARLTDQATESPLGPYTLGLKPLSIGSDPRCDVQVAGVAARQAEVGPSRSGFILRDLAGGATKVNGQSVDELLLADGDLIQIGALSLKFSQV
jgi:hypothetical protein